MSSAQFYYYKNRGQTLGPFDLGQIQQRAKRAQISNRSVISTDGFSWQPAQNFPEIFAGNTAAPPSAAMSAAVPAVAVVEEAAEWYYMLNGEQQGPVTESQLQQMIGLGNVKDTDHVWKDGMIDWLEIRNVPDLSVQQANAPQPMMQQPMMQQPMMQQPAMQQPNAAGVGMQVFCTNCGASIPQQAAVCVHCGVANKATSVASNVFSVGPVAPGEVKSKSTAAILALLLGGIGLHKFYTGHILLGIIYIIFCPTLIPALVAFVEGILYLSAKSDEEFTQKYCAS